MKNIFTHVAEGKPAEYSTTDLGVAAALLSCNFTLIRFDNSEPRRVVFYFLDKPGLRDVVSDFWNDKFKVKGLTFYNCLKTLKSRIHS